MKQVLVISGLLLALLIMLLTFSVKLGLSFFRFFVSL